MLLPLLNLHKPVRQSKAWELKALQERMKNEMKDRLLWEEITSDSANPLHELLPAQRARSFRKRGHNYILPPVRTERFKRCFF